MVFIPCPHLQGKGLRIPLRFEIERETELLYRITLFLPVSQSIL